MFKTITAYVFDKTFTGMPEADAAKLTHVNYSFALIKEGRADVSHWQHEKELLDLMKNTELPVCLSIGGWGADGFSQAVTNQDDREVLADSIIELIEKYGFKGVDLDWEYPGSAISGIAASFNDFYNYPVFINLLREKLNILSTKTGISYQLTLATGATQECIEGIRYGEMTEAVDQINIMTYDLAPWGKESPAIHHTALFSSVKAEGMVSGDSAVRAFIRSGVPAEKLVLGAAFYGRKHTGVIRGETNGLHQPHESAAPEGMPYKEICARLLGTAKRYWDEEAKAPYIYDEADKLFATYDDPESILHKTRYVKENGLGGIMFWSYLGADTARLLEAISDGMKD